MFKLFLFFSCSLLYLEWHSPFALLKTNVLLVLFVPRCTNLYYKIILVVGNFSQVFLKRNNWSQCVVEVERSSLSTLVILTECNIVPYKVNLLVFPCLWYVRRWTALMMSIGFAIFKEFSCFGDGLWFYRHVALPLYLSKIIGFWFHAQHASCLLLIGKISECKQGFMVAFLAYLT